MGEKEVCPVCRVQLNETSGDDLHCRQCGRLWYWTEADGEKTLASRQRKVAIKKWPPEKGDRLEDIITAKAE